MASWVNRTVLSGSSVDENGTSSHTCTYTAAMAGNLLVAVIAGGVTSTTPSGWTLTASSVFDTGLYVFTKTASSGESSFSTTHNASNYMIKGLVYEFPSGTVVIGSSTDYAQANNGSITTPAITSLYGSYTRFCARSQPMSTGVSTGTISWSTPANQDYDSYSTVSSHAGMFLGVGTDDTGSGATFTPSFIITTTGESFGGEAISWALTIPQIPIATTAWLRF